MYVVRQRHSNPLQNPEKKFILHSFRFISSPNYYIVKREREKNWKFFGDCCTPNFTFHFRLYPFVDRCCLQPIFNSSYNNHNKNGIEIAIKQQGALKNSKKVQFAEGVLFASSTVFEKISEWKGPFVLQSEGKISKVIDFSF